jgi:hypothetical protein
MLVPDADVPGCSRDRRDLPRKVNVLTSIVNIRARKQQKGRLVGDGLPHLLSSRSFVRHVIMTVPLYKYYFPRAMHQEHMCEHKSVDYYL